MGVASFVILADADADLLARVGATLNLLNVMPRAFHLEARDAGTAAVRASVDCADHQAQLVARKLWRLTAVRDVTLVYDAGS
jgi:hypothetical protein